MCSCYSGRGRRRRPVTWLVESFWCIVCDYGFIIKPVCTLYYQAQSLPVEPSLLCPSSWPILTPPYPLSPWTVTHTVSSVKGLVWPYSLKCLLAMYFFQFISSSHSASGVSKVGTSSFYIQLSKLGCYGLDGQITRWVKNWWFNRLRGWWWKGDTLPGCPLRAEHCS